MRPHKATIGGGILGLFGQNGGKGFSGVGGGTFGKHRLGGLDRFGQTAVLGVQGGQFFDKRLDFGIGHGTLKAIERLPLKKAVDGGNRLDAQLLRQCGGAVDVDLDHANAAFGGGHGSL